LAQVKFEKFSNATREKIFQIATNYDSFQTILPEFFPSIRVISVRPNTTLVEEHLKLAGKEMIVMAKHVTNEPNFHEIFFVGGDAKGTHIIEEYEQIQEGTRIVLTVDFKLQGPMRLKGVFVKGKVENEFSKIMDKLILAAEN
jgi:coenzyme Q-binding protein COQ10